MPAAVQASCNATSGQEKPMHHESPWTDVTKARLRNLWLEGLSTAEIGRRLNVSKNSVIGQAHRLDLPKRPYPIKYSDGQTPRRVSAPPPPRLPPRLSNVACFQQTPAAHDIKPEIDAGSLIPMPPRPPGAATPSARLPSYRITECCWPIGDPGTSNFRFCDEPALPGKPYCGAHARLAYVKARTGAEREIA
jgi:GcrA cell cycle regulator